MEKEWLKELVEQGLSITQIATHGNVCSSTVRYWLKKFDLRTVRWDHGKIPKDFNFPRKCSKCGETRPKKFYGNKRYTCGKCQNKYNHQKGRDNRKKALEHLGGKCIICGYNDYSCSLDFHHLCPETKDPNFKSYRGWTWERTIKELESCVIVCRNCHQAIHTGLLDLKDTAGRTGDDS